MCETSKRGTRAIRKTSMLFLTPRALSVNDAMGRTDNSGRWNLLRGTFFVALVAVRLLLYDTGTHFHKLFLI